jgi:uncharacterized iron-regulated protein
MCIFPVMRTAAVLTALVALASGCASTPHTPDDPPKPHVHGSGGGMDIHKAALPFRILRAHGGAEVAEADFFAELAAADAVCLGEEHNNPHHHWMQLMVLEHLSRAAAGQRTLGVGFEMFQRPFQGVLDDYAGGRIDEKALLARSGWHERWGYPYEFYRPMVELAVAGHHALLALNAPRELTRKVGKQGLAALSAEEKLELPELDLADDTHRSWFRSATSGHAGAADSTFENFYTAQVIWDETMADTAARWLEDRAEGSPHRQVAILAGVGHCFDAAIPKRLRRRGVAKALSVQAVIDDGGSAVADELAAPGNDFVVVLDATPHPPGRSRVGNAP